MRCGPRGGFAPQLLGSGLLVALSSPASAGASEPRPAAAPPGRVAVASQGATPEAKVEPEASSEPISKARYVTAGIVGTLLGYGIGHAVAGEWDDVGYLFTVSELSVVLVAGLVVDSPLGGLSERKGSESGAFVGLMGAFVALRVWEAIDVWTRPVVAEDPETGAGAPAVAVWSLVPGGVVGSPGVVLLGRF